MKKVSSALDYNLYIRRDFSLQDEVELPSDFDSKFPNFVSQLLLYDQICIETHDFAILQPLIKWLGVNQFNEVLGSGALKFLRHSEVLGYENGKGIIHFDVLSPDGSPMPPHINAGFSETTAAIEYQIKEFKKTLPRRGRRRFIDRISDATTEITLSNEDFLKNVERESYRDIESTEILNRFVSRFYGKKIEEIIWKHIEPNGKGIHLLQASGKVIDPIDLLLKVAELNLKILISASQNTGGLILPLEGISLLEGKLLRAGVGKGRLNEFTKLLNLNGIPDIRPALASGNLKFREIWSIRNKSNAREFRKWISEADPKDSDELLKLYVSTLKKQPAISSLPSRILRFVITTAAGTIPGVGLVTGVVDSFFLDELLGGRSPRLFLDDLAKLLPGSDV